MQIMPERDIILPLTIEELEAGVRLLDTQEMDHRAFWELNVAAFRRTLLVALRETSEALSAQNVPLEWRDELEGQITLLQQWIDVADHRMAGRA